MIVDLPETTVAKVSRALVTIREEGGAVALGRVLTLVISAEVVTLVPPAHPATEANRLSNLPLGN